MYVLNMFNSDVLNKSDLLYITGMYIPLGII